MRCCRRPRSGAHKPASLVKITLADIRSVVDARNTGFLLGVDPRNKVPAILLEWGVGKGLGPLVDGVITRQDIFRDLDR